MQPIRTLAPSTLKSVRVLLTDMDETLTFKGRLASATYQSLEDLQRAGIRVIINTAAPAGWCDQMARMWPVDGVIGENGGLFFRQGEGEELVREFWHDDAETNAVGLKALAAQLAVQYPQLAFADDQAYRRTSLAFRRLSDAELQASVLASVKGLGASGTVNNLWLLAWLGDYDKLAMARRILKAHFALDIDREADQVVYVGDSENDGPMFRFFKRTFGVSTVVGVLDRLAAPPAWITAGPGGAGFVEVAHALIASRQDME